MNEINLTLKKLNDIAKGKEEQMIYSNLTCSFNSVILTAPNVNEQSMPVTYHNVADNQLQSDSPNITNQIAQSFYPFTGF